MKKIFKKAHEMTRKMKESYPEVDYQTQFGLYVSYLFEEEKEAKEMISTKKIEEMILEKSNIKTEVTINEWEKYGKHRVYINVQVKNRRRSVTSFIDLHTDKIVTKNNDSYKDWIMSVVDATDEIVKEYEEEIIELAIDKKEEKTSLKKDNKETRSNNNKSFNSDLHSEYLGLSNNLSSEDFEDITGMKKFDEWY